MPITMLPEEKAHPLATGIGAAVKGFTEQHALGVKAQKEGAAKQTELLKVGYNQKKNAVDMLIKTVAPKLDKENRVKLWENKDTAEQVEEIYGGDVLAALKGSAGVGEQPSWAQVQKIASIKSGAREGFYSVATLLGEPEAVKIDTRQDLLKIIYDANLDPASFTDELAALPSVPAEKPDKGGLFRDWLDRGKKEGGEVSKEDKTIKADITAMGGQGKLRAQATKILKDKSYPVDEANIKALIEQLRKGTK